MGRYYPIFAIRIGAEYICLPIENRVESPNSRLSRSPIGGDNAIMQIVSQCYILRHF